MKSKLAKLKRSKKNYVDLQSIKEKISYVNLEVVRYVKK